MNAREMLIYFAIKYQGNFQDIYRALILKEEADPYAFEGYMKHVKCKILTFLDPEYPDYLKQSYKPPFVLFYYGDISLIQDMNKNLAVVGSRDADQQTLLNVHSLVEEVSQKLNIVSGLARGIDATAHWGAIEGGGKTIAVLGCGIDVCFPTCNQTLYDEIKAHHLIISEYFNYIPPLAEHFPWRNRIIVALSRGTLLGAANHRSGSQITGNLTMAVNKELMVLPSSDIKNSFCDLLIQEGCPVVLNADDIYHYLGM